MNRIHITLAQLCNMLKTIEGSLQKEIPQALLGDVECQVIPRTLGDMECIRTRVWNFVVIDYFIYITLCPHETDD